MTMDLFEQITVEGHEQILICSDPPTGLKAMIAIHDTRLGPALGGCRMWPYPSFEAALSDVLRLSKAMTYKAAVSGLPLGGGKSVIWGDAKTDKTEAQLKSFARQVATLGGRYLVAEDVGISLDDIELMRQVTPHVAGYAREKGGSGDPSPATAYGVFRGMRACLKEAYGDDTFKGRSVAIQGLGKVGYALAALLHQEGVRLYISDMDPERVALASRDFGADPLLGHEIYRVDCDIFSPCALGGMINTRTVPQLSCRIIAGAANNQLESMDVAAMLEPRKILYAPDYVINAGGLINIAEELKAYSKERAYRKVSEIEDRLGEVFTLAREASITTLEAANRFAGKRLALSET